jgi:hypothetical protein
MLPVMGFIRVILNRSILATRRRPGLGERVADRCGTGRLANRRDPLDEPLGAAQESVFVGHDAQTRRGVEKFSAGEK